MTDFNIGMMNKMILIEKIAQMNNTPLHLAENKRNNLLVIIKNLRKDHASDG